MIVRIISLYGISYKTRKEAQLALFDYSEWLLNVGVRFFEECANTIGEILINLAISLRRNRDKLRVEFKLN
jgi:hypothetical protein